MTNSKDGSLQFTALGAHLAPQQRLSHVLRFNRSAQCGSGQDITATVIRGHSVHKRLHQVLHCDEFGCHVSGHGTTVTNLNEYI